MNIIAFNGSARGIHGNTSIIMNEMKKGVEKNGSSMEIINLIDCDIHVCRGCLKCWERKNLTDVECVHNDDAVRLIRKMISKDLIILASPLYYENISSVLKTFIERFILLHTSYIVSRDNNLVHDIKIKIPPIAFLCSCDLPGLDNFKIVSQYMKRVAWDLQTELVAELYQCEARLIQYPKSSIRILISAQKNIWEAAGSELAVDGRLSGKTIQYLRTPMIPYKEYIESANEIAKSISDK